MLRDMKLRILRGRSRRKLSRERWRGRSRRFTVVQSAVEALWSQGLALRMSLPEDGADDDRSQATLGQWRSFVGLFLSENVCRARVPDEFAIAEPADEPADQADDAAGDDAADEPDHGARGAPAEERAPAAVYDVCLEALAATAHDLADADVLAAPLPLHAAAATCGCPIERVLAIKVRGIPRI